jgi:hypothetical protein
MAKKQQPGQEFVRYEVLTQEDPDTGDVLLPIPLPLLKQLGWKEGDNVDFSIGEDGCIYIKKAF